MNKYLELMKAFGLSAAMTLSMLAALWAGAQAGAGNLVPGKCWALSFAALTAAVPAGFAVREKMRARRRKAAFPPVRRRSALGAYSARAAKNCKKAG
ncbi:MAG: hypothetical protein IK083_08440 [Abditibacteriota bacterium]|nr:hypothetical protein [Abditibacteriota bacterium]